MANSNRYEKVKIYRIEDGKDKGNVVRATKFYDKVPASDNDIYVITQEGDRFDLLADQFYGNSNMWWFIARANNMKFNNIPVGTTLRIPSEINTANTD